MPPVRPRARARRRGWTRISPVTGASRCCTTWVSSWASSWRPAPPRARTRPARGRCPPVVNARASPRTSASTMSLRLPVCRHRRGEQAAATEAAAPRGRRREVRLQPGSPRTSKRCPPAIPTNATSASWRSTPATSSPANYPAPTTTTTPTASPASRCRPTRARQPTTVTLPAVAARTVRGLPDAAALALVGPNGGGPRWASTAHRFAVAAG